MSLQDLHVGIDSDFTVEQNMFLLRHFIFLTQLFALAFLL